MGFCRPGQRTHTAFRRGGQSNRIMTGYLLGFVRFLFRRVAMIELAHWSLAQSAELNMKTDNRLTV